ncbi:ABC transporter permease [Endozoicomonas sp. (ex Bugula neritina AB1)]|nr:ABC transporter permease [Endozoicomonas sp. (ex Bugula neritina AB1)]
MTDIALSHSYQQKSVYRRLAIGLAVATVLGLVFLLSIAVGPLSLSLPEVLSALGHVFNNESLNDVEQLNATVVWDLRLARAVTALIVGGSLAACGAAMQGLFGNPLADPGIVGVSSGASLGAIFVIVLGLSTFGVWTLPAGAFLAGIATTFIIYSLSKPGEGGADSSRLLLVGIAINAISGAIAGLMTYLATTDQLMSLTFWSMGSLSSASWTTVAITIVPALAGLLMLQFWAKQLDLLALGEREARHLGVDVDSLRRWLVVITALLVASAVSFSGTIGFVGLIVPHIIRLTIGPMHRYLLPLSALGGALLLMLADIAARTLDPPGEVPLGVLMGAIGGPFFLWMIWRGKDKR